jgi:uncharacterized coiled-coil DUF342 family protein
MSDEHADFINGLHVVENELERVIGELDEMQDRRGIPALDRVSLNTLQWALNKLADDLHDAIAEIRKARLEVVSARRGEEDAREVRDAACQLHLFECRKHSAEVERRLALEKQLAEVTAERDEARQQQQAEQLQWASFYNGLGAELHKVKAERDGLQRQVAELTEKTAELERERDLALSRLGEIPEIPECPCCGDPGYRRGDGWQCETCGTDWGEEAKADQEPYPWQIGDEIECIGVWRKVIDRREGWVFLEGVTSPWSQPDWERRGWKLYRKASDVPPETAPEPYQWQDGDTVSSRDVKILPYDCLYKVKRLSCGRVALIGLTGMFSQADWEKHGFTLNRKASDLPDIAPPTSQQVAEFAAVAEPIDDSVGTDGEGQS